MNRLLEPAQANLRFQAPCHSAHWFTAEEFSERGNTMLEYALIAACLAIVAIAGVTSLGVEMERSLKTVSLEIMAAGPVNPDG